MNSRNSTDKILRLVFVRHEQPYYKDVGHDLTPQGVQGARQIGEKLINEKFIDKTKEVLLLHSPKPRAKGTLEYLVEGAGISGSFTEVADIRSSDFADLEAFLKREKDLALTLDDVAREHYENDDLYKNSPHIVETHYSRQKRLYSFLSQLIREHVESGHNDKQIIAVSHFEIIMHIIDDVFDIRSFSTYMAPALGEFVVIDVNHTNDPGVFQLCVSFRDRKECKLFNLQSQSII
ncbi:histidine phosphatase family protein [bacterium]|nr:histidine phosphatase family protein [bacterium]